MAVETISLSNPHIPRGLQAQTRVWRRLKARCRLWRMVTRREIFLASLDRRARLDIGRPAPRQYRWLDELMRGQRP